MDSKQAKAKVVGVADEQNSDEPNVLKGGLWKRSMLVVPVMIVTDEEGDAEK
ncbi:hypothetical protein Tco_0049055, partial [Tanacetum coccineum]